MKKIIVVGGGFSGLIAGIFSKNKDNQVIILERNNSCGKKILVTGNGRCNYSNNDQSINHYHTSSSISLDSIINKHNISKILNFYQSIGIFPRIKNGYYYPYSNQAVTMQNALINECTRKNIIIKTNTYVKSVTKNNDIFYIETDNETYTCDSVIIANGSKAYPKIGTDGNGYDLVRSFNHTLIKPLPALVGLKCVQNIKELSGVRSDVKLSLYENNKFIASEIGEIQFNDYGISGICSMQLSHFISKGIDNNNNNNNEKVIINFVNSITESRDELIKIFDKMDNFYIHNILDSFLNYKITNYITKKLYIDNSTKWFELNIDKKYEVVDSIINFELSINDTNSFDKAQICCGGVNLNEINLSTMESKLVNNLYIVGEILDVNGDCGGYNITFASISGMLAGIEAGKND